MDDLKRLGLMPGEAVDPSNRISKAFVEEGKVVEFSIQMIPWYAFSSEPFKRKIAKDRQSPRLPEKFHPLLQQWLAERSGDEVDFFLINFRDDLLLPRFPEPPSDKYAYEQALERSAELIQQIKARRADNYEKLRQELGQNYRAEVLEIFWLINAVVVKTQLGAVTEIAQREDVLYIEPRYSGEEPPQIIVSDDSDPNNDVQDGRILLASDPYFNLGLTDGRIGLLDSGVYFDHLLFDQSKLGFRGDCVNGGANCNTGSALNPNDDCWDHGTASAAILMAETSQLTDLNQRDAFRGVTGIILDSYKVYPSVSGTEHCTGLLDAQAAVWGFETAVAKLDKVIVAEIQSNGSDLGTISTAADNAFDTGSVIIAANGNNGNNGKTPYSVNAPANAHKAIGVGEIYVEPGQQATSNQSVGPARDERYKPDIQAPTRTETASNASNTALRIFEGTSGATPYAAGAAALLRNWLIQCHPSNLSVDPGQVYAQLILFAQYPFTPTPQQPYLFDNTVGAGPLRLMASGESWWGNVSVTPSHRVVNLTLNVTGTTYNTLDAAIWWPEAPPKSSSTLGEIHNDIDLYLIDPDGNERASSRSGPSVFERVRVAGPIATGNWTLRIRGYRVLSGSQTVYWTAFAHLMSDKA